MINSIITVGKRVFHLKIEPKSRRTDGVDWANTNLYKHVLVTIKVDDRPEQHQYFFTEGEKAHSTPEEILWSLTWDAMAVIMYSLPEFIVEMGYDKRQGTIIYNGCREARDWFNSVFIGEGELDSIQLELESRLNADN